MPQLNPVWIDLYPDGNEIEVTLVTPPNENVLVFMALDMSMIRIYGMPSRAVRGLVERELYRLLFSKPAPGFKPAKIPEGAEKLSLVSANLEEVIDLETKNDLLNPTSW